MKCNLLSPSICHANWMMLEGQVLLDQERMEKYSNDSRLLVRVKCLGVFVANPLRVVICLIVSLAKTLFLLLEPLFKITFLIGQGYVQKKKKKEIEQQIKEEYAFWPASFKEALQSPLWSLFYGSVVQIASAWGVVDPFRGRKVVAHAEMKWAFFDHFLGESVTLAPCFKPRAYQNLDQGFSFAWWDELYVN